MFPEAPMYSALEALFSKVDKRYLTSDELKALGRYSLSLPHRLALYRRLREAELEIFQAIADQMEAKLPQESQENLERSLKGGIGALRQCAMSMLMDEPALSADQIRWLRLTQRSYGSESLDSLMFGLLHRQLEQRLNPKQMTFFERFFQPFQTLELP